MAAVNTGSSYNRAVLLSITVALLFTGCTSTSSLYKKETLDYKSRAETRKDGGVLVSASALSVDEGRDVYDINLAKKNIQAVWIEVENGEDGTYWLLSPGVDPNFYPASEVAEAFFPTPKDETREVLEQRFTALAFRNPVPPGKKVSGFILTHLDEGVKMIQVDLVGDRRHRSFTFFSSIPGFDADYRKHGTSIRSVYSDEEIINYADDNSFRGALETLPCCTSNKEGSRYGDPLNLVVVGGTDDLAPAFVRRGWRPTEQTWLGSVTKMVGSALSGKRYPYAPISPLYLYGRPQDFALQKARDNIHQRNHLRLWLSPMKYHGKPVWVGQISRDIGTRFTFHSPYLITHKIDPDVDEARTALQEDMAYSQSLVKLGLVKGVGDAAEDAPRFNLTTDPYYTDGVRAVLVFDVHPRAITDIKFLPWESNEGGFIKQ